MTTMLAATDGAAESSASRGGFITLEGGEGVGKSTNAIAVVEWLKARGFDVILTREPGGTPLAESVRELALASSNENMPGTAELLLMFAARSIHVANKIEPALAKGTWVVCDRFVDASYAYQGSARGLGFSAIEALEKMVVPSLKPDLTLLLDADPAVGRQRISTRSQDRIEQEKLAFFDKVRKGYQARLSADPKRFAVIDAAEPLEQVQTAVATALETFLCARNASGDQQ